MVKNRSSKTALQSKAKESKSIGDEAFSWCTKLASINIPSSVTTIGYQAFAHCRKIYGIDIPMSVTSLGTGAFYSCSGLKSITLPASLIKVNDHAFAYCWSLTTVDIPQTIDSIGDYAFFDCGEIISFTCRATTPPAVYSADVFAFEDMSSSATLYVPMSAVEDYKTAEVWKEFPNIVGFEETFVIGDVDGDGMVSIADVTELIDLLLNGATSTSPAADVDGDGTVSIADVTELIDYLLTH
jgi:hypothetical protein